MIRNTCRPHILVSVNKGRNKTQLTPDNSNVQGKSKKVRVIGSSKQIAGSKEKTSFYCTFQWGGVIVYHYNCYSVSNSYWARSMYAVTVKPMCSLINTVLSWSAILRAVVCLPENIAFLATRNRATMPSLGKIEEFNSATTSINRYLERLEQYFVENSVPSDSAESHKRRAILISVIGAKAYDVLSDLCSPTPPSEKTYAQLTTILKNHFAPKKLVIA